jgi:hypothetical protein
MQFPTWEFCTYTYVPDRAYFKENLRIHLKRFIQKELGTKPVIVTTIVEV